MSNLYILTEERAKPNVIENILKVYSKEYKKALKTNNELIIMPEINSKEVFTNEFKIINAEINGIEEIYLKIASGNSSFVDFLVFLWYNEGIGYSCQPKGRVKNGREH